MTQIPLKTLHDWCAQPKTHEHKGTCHSNLKRDEFTNFLMQDMISYSHPCKRYSGKKFLMHTLEETYRRYSQQTDFHKNGKISQTAMQQYKPKYILLAGQTPVNQCLCDYSENCDLLLKGLVAIGLKGLPSNRYSCVDSTFCDVRHGQFGMSYSFVSKQCIRRECMECGIHKL